MKISPKKKSKPQTKWSALQKGLMKNFLITVPLYMFYSFLLLLNYSLQPTVTGK
jgi:hypothetical protein